MVSNIYSLTAWQFYLKGHVRFDFGVFFLIELC